MINYEMLLKYNLPETKTVMVKYIQELKEMLLAADKRTIRDLVDAKFSGSPKINTVMSKIHGGRSSLIAWMAANCYFINEQDTIACFSEEPHEVVVDRFTKMGGVAKAITTYHEPLTVELLKTAMKTSSLIIIDQPGSFQEIRNIILESYSTVRTKKSWRGILIGVNHVVPSGVNVPSYQDPNSFKQAMELSDVVLNVSLRQDEDEAPSISTLKTRWCNNDHPALYQLPNEIIKLLKGSK